MNVEIECTPEEARRFLGLPDVSKAHEVYVETVINAMKGVSSPDQLNSYIKQLAPMGEMGLKLFQQLMEHGTGAAMAGFKAGTGNKG
ncbi:hypothetical protein Y88_2050 [Novosphingobium nitrogenifigens DSM 19370]|uniref:Uncharacterized protein n=1 Tax=Novosphingobium nitrogenifigens DSM 19370 TaxID=983920 RepID=F1Z5R6_9SPHN|nr:hypothetical protein Y88_2050 [Novosphingobium nitrogenifigens DSM 19370]